MVLSTEATPLKDREKIVEEKPEELLYTYKKGDPFGAKARGLAQEQKKLQHNESSYLQTIVAKHQKLNPA